MRITVTVDDPTDDFRDQLLALLAEHALHLDVDATWTVERALQYYRTLPARARHIVHMAVIRHGFVDDDELRADGGSLRGHSGALKRVLERGVREGWWPTGMQPPIQAQGPGFGKVKGYSMPGELVDVFSAAIDRHNKQK
ncbi:hypothetical protein BU52_32145 [Streptomyces toyocaensis]|uniref:Uncharacterized protein n=1 Tax=Streptomyces toyocaensis TaxID=55952 RepID=A0A081XHT2_STRTO|nr:hypothetical protein [Streptomyces toyocaensis]KES03105.1 hypothetical protein BU52_32145 [Streptomyces toyocaensis]